ncbi:hypothetical protein P3X46_016345 [Hevea brasiliensis]|uniref:Uncharacterized protein n=1 Tax=Hevea brasiliensis TaxID=3981 RepID=A0ABQ9LYT3_HEVBR|nr:hypothetical protein P3X46_016345 [Hevea brasiliensis]
MGIPNTILRKFPLALFALFILLYTNRCRAALLAKSNNTFHCNGRDDCFISDDLELESFMESYASIYSSRMLAANVKIGVIPQDSSDTPKVCPNSPQYCYPPRTPERCKQSYNRNC